MLNTICNAKITILNISQGGAKKEERDEIVFSYNKDNFPTINRLERWARKNIVPIYKKDSNCTKVKVYAKENGSHEVQTAKRINGTDGLETIEETVIIVEFIH